LWPPPTPTFALHCFLHLPHTLLAKYVFQQNSVMPPYSIFEDPGLWVGECVTGWAACSGSEPSGPRWLLDSADEGATLLQNTRNCLPNNTVTHSSRLESSSASLWEAQTSHYSIIFFLNCSDLGVMISPFVFAVDFLTTNTPTVPSVTSKLCPYI
jgi:hypothetical protein